MAPKIYRSYLLAILLVIFAFNYVDRFALGLVLENIKGDLHLSDTQLGLMSGIAFALFYSLMGIPIARWADRGNRVTIIALTTAVWSLMVALCGRAMNFSQLLLIRIGVGVGEAGCIPPAHSLIADYFSRAERPRAVATYMQGPTLSVVIGYLLAGWLNDYYGWRMMFVLLSLPGVVMAILAYFTLREPRVTTLLAARRAAGDPGSGTTRASPMHGSRAEQPSLKELYVALGRNATFRHLLIAYSIVSFFNYGIGNWQPTFFVRSFGLTSGEIGRWFAVVYGLSTFLGVYLGGEWASRRAALDEPRQFRIMAAANVVFNVALWSLIYLSRNRYVAFALMGLSNFGSAAIYGPLFAAFQTLVQPRMRAMSIAIVYLFSNLIGMGLGPLAVGAMSDGLRPLFGDESLRYALLGVCPGYLLVSWHLWKASKTVKRDLDVIVGSEAIADESCMGGDEPIGQRTTLNLKVVTNEQV